MKKILALMLSVMMLLCACCTAEVAADEVITDDIGIVTFNVVMDKIPDGYEFTSSSWGGVLYFSIDNNSDPEAVWYYGSVAHSEEFDNEETGAYTLDVESLTEEQLAQVEEMFSAGYNSPVFTYSKTTHGTDIIIVRETNCDTEFAEVYTIYQGYFICVGALADGELNDEIIDACVTIMSDLWIVAE